MTNIYITTSKTEQYEAGIITTTNQQSFAVKGYSCLLNYVF